ncbi:MarR family winged helix-turn-helix transcriptional regulator [Clostridium ihumii]|uniref:MarR family winged helix-turn-helix transcriptional regulator n=1 Tax=Clostridium ihumii TaxID=1470356 RepID=UPI0006868C3A|nr:MarR family transcriptional regulator [Clostridium ihumii]
MRSSKEFNEHILLGRLESKIYYEWCQKKGISYSLLQILDLLYEYPDGVEAKFISETMFIYKQTLTGLLKQLHNNGYIKTEKDIIDKRRKLISLTDKGTIYVESILNDLYKKEDLVFNCLNDEEKITFNKLYKKIVTNLQKELGEESE